MQWLHGHGTRKMRHVAFAGWRLMAAALIVSSLVMIARSFGVPATMHSIFTAYSSGSILKHQPPFAPCAVGSGSSRAKGRLMICQHQVFPQLLIELSRVDVLLGCRHVVICPESIILSGNQYVLYLPSVTASL